VALILLPVLFVLLLLAVYQVLVVIRFTTGVEEFYANDKPDEVHRLGVSDHSWNGKQYGSAIMMIIVLCIFFGVIAPCFDYDEASNLAVMIVWSVLCAITVGLVFSIEFSNPSKGIALKDFDLTRLDAKTRSTLFAHTCPKCPRSCAFYAKTNRYHCKRCNKVHTAFVCVHCASYPPFVGPRSDLCGAVFYWVRSPLPVPQPVHRRGKL
jgi:hypothetical protein